PAGDVAARFAALGELAAGLRTHKLIFLARRGGLRPRGAEADLPIINLATDYDSLIATRALPPKQLYLLAHARALLTERVSHKMLIAVTSPLQLLRELFTVKGAGTLIKRGAQVSRHKGYAEVDAGRLKALFESSFGRAPARAFFERDVSCIYLEEGYQGAALVRTTPLGGYLTKFAVTREAQGEGIGRDLWQLVVADYPTLFWRPRPLNPHTARPPPHPHTQAGPATGHKAPPWAALRVVPCSVPSCPQPAPRTPLPTRPHSRPIFRPPTRTIEIARILRLSWPSFRREGRIFMKRPTSTC